VGCPLYTIDTTKQEAAAEGRTTLEGKLATSSRSDGRNTGREGPRNTPASTRRGPGGQKPGEEGKNGEGITMTGMAIAMAATATKKAGLTVADENDVLRDGMYHKSDVEEMICPFADRNCEGQWCMAWKHAIDDWNFGYCGLVPRDD